MATAFTDKTAFSYIFRSHDNVVDGAGYAMTTAPNQGFSWVQEPCLCFMPYMWKLFLDTDHIFARITAVGTRGPGVENAGNWNQAGNCDLSVTEFHTGGGDPLGHSKGLRG